MKLIVGIGNPGEKYERTRHNVGFMTVDLLAKKMNIGEWEENRKFDALVAKKLPVALLMKPQTQMNSSGRAVKRLVNFYKIYFPYIWVIHDDLDIKLGEYKLQQGHGPKLHYGVNSIEKALGSEAFNRVRVGVDNRAPDNRIAGEDYVLQNFDADEEVVINKIINKVVDELVSMVAGN